MTGALVTVLAASLAGSLHCAGMCGGLVAVYAGADTARGLARGASHLAYNGGRLAGYVLLGGAAGAAGGALDRAGALAGLQRAGLVVAGALILLWGAFSLVAALGARVPAVPLPRALQRGVGRAMGQVAALPPVARATAIGLLSALLPCGWLWAFVLTAAGSGSAPAGALVMAAFWLGTVPVLAGLGLGIQVLAAPLRRYVPVVSAVLLLVIGLVTIAGRTRALAADGAAPGAAPACCDHGHR